MYRRGSASEPTTVVCESPLRIDLSGGIVDVSPMVEDLGGYIVNVAIDSAVRVHCRSSRTRGVAIGEARLTSRTRLEGLSRALERLYPGLNMIGTIEYPSPVGSGMGTSGAASVALVAATRTIMGLASDDRLAVAREAFELEQSIGVIGGSQDQVAAAVGGLNAISYGSQGATLKAIGTPAQWKTLQEWLLVLKPPGKRQSGDVIRHVLASYSESSRSVLGALTGLSSIAREIDEALSRGRYAELGPLLDATHLNQVRLHPAVGSPDSAALIADVRSVGALGAKLLGAGGEGACILLACPPDKHESVVAQARKWRTLPVPFRIQNAGFRTF